MVTTIRLSITCVLSLAASAALAQAPFKQKTWRFALPDGPLMVGLSVYADGTSSLGPISRVPTSEQTGALEQVLSEMPSLGADPHKLVYIGMNILPSDAFRKLAYACADSRDCRFTAKSAETDEVHVLIQLLNKSDAFATYNELFKRYGIRAEVTAAEKITFAGFSTVPPRNARDRANGKMLVLSGGQIGMRLFPVRDKR